MKYRKKPIVVHAVKNDGHWSTIIKWIQEIVPSENGWLIPFGTRPRITRNEDGSLNLITIEGNEVVCPVGAYVVIDKKGYPYPCDGELFEQMHDPVEES